MKQIYSILAAMVIAQLASAQITLVPKWTPGTTETLELVESKMSSEQGKPEERDSTYSVIEQQVVSEDVFKTHFVWNVKSYYRDTTHMEAKSKANALYAMLFAGRCPIRFFVRKDDYKLEIENEKEIDSVIEQVSKEVAATSPKKEAVNNEFAASLLGLAANKEITKSLTGLPDKYFSVYKEPVFKLGEKKDLLKEDESKKMEGIGMGMTGYTVWEETAANSYRKHTEGNMNGDFLSKLVGALKGAFTEEEKKGKKKGKSKKEETPKTSTANADYMNVTLVSNTVVDKSTYNLTSFDIVTKSDIQMMGEKGSGVELLRLKKIK